MKGVAHCCSLHLSKNKQVRLTCPSSQVYTLDSSRDGIISTYSQILFFFTSCCRFLWLSSFMGTDVSLCHCLWEFSHGFRSHVTASFIRAKSSSFVSLCFLFYETRFLSSSVQIYSMKTGCLSSCFCSHSSACKKMEIPKTLLLSKIVQALDAHMLSCMFYHYFLPRYFLLLSRA